VLQSLPESSGLSKSNFPGSLFQNPQLRWIADSNLIPLISYHNDGLITGANDAFLQMVGYTRQDLIEGKVNWLEMTPSEWRAADASALERLRTEGTTAPFEKQYICKDGRRIWVRLQGTNFDCPPEQGISYVQDITAQRLAEHETFETRRALAENETRLRRHEERLSMAIRHARVGFYDWDILENRLVFSDQMMRDWGIEGSNNVETLESALDLIHVEDRDRVKKQIAEAVEDHQPYRIEYRVVHPNGKVVWVDVHGSVIYDDKDAPVRFFGTSIDITSRKEQDENLRRAAAAVFNERENFRSLFKQTPEMVCILSGPEHVFEFVNEAHIRALGFDATGMSVRTAQPESVEVHGILDEVYRTGVPAELREIPITLTDRLRYFNLTYSARRDQQGAINGIMILGVEISGEIKLRDELARATQHAQENVEKLNAVVHHLSEGVFFGDQMGNLLLMNSEALRIHGFAEVDDMKKRVREYPDLFALKTVEGGDVPAENWPIYRAIRGEKFTDFEVELVRKDSGKSTFVSYGGTPVFDEKGTFLLAVLTIRDITERRITEQALREAVRSRDDFLSIASHELKTPITSLKLQAQIARRSYESGRETYHPKQVDQMMELIERQADRLNRLVDDMLDIAHIRSGRLNVLKDTVRLDKVVAEVVERFGPILKQAGSTVSFEAQAMLEGNWDRVRLEQVVTNLLTNAMRYGNKKPVTVVVSKSPQAPDMARLEVRDLGMGISPNSRDRIFNRFERDVNNNEVSGLGLGLFIARQIVEAHGGHIWAESPGINQGSTFIVEIPLA
jgi:PAS domain S-box-containing protein